METASYYQIIVYFTTKQMVAFIPRERSEGALCYSRDGSSYSNSMAQLMVKVHKMTSQARDIWEWSFSKSAW